MIRTVLETVAETPWREWIACLAEFTGLAVIVASIALICIGFTPDGTPQELRP